MTPWRPLSDNTKSELNAVHSQHSKCTVHKMYGRGLEPNVEKKIFELRELATKLTWALTSLSLNKFFRIPFQNSEKWNVYSEIDRKIQILRLHLEFIEESKLKDQRQKWQKTFTSDCRLRRERLDSQKIWDWSQNNAIKKIFEI